MKIDHDTVDVRAIRTLAGWVGQVYDNNDYHHYTEPKCTEELAFATAYKWLYGGR